MSYSRRRFLNVVAGSAAALAVSGQVAAVEAPRKQHLVTLSFDDGFKKSFMRTAEIYEKYKLSACFNVVAAGIPQDEYIKASPLGDFGLWNELKRRGHEVMPHGYRHENVQKFTCAGGSDLIRRCLRVFAEKLDGFDPKQAIFNFPLQRIHARTGAVAAHAGASVSDRRGCNPTSTPARTGEADVHQLWAG